MNRPYENHRMNLPSHNRRPVAMALLWGVIAFGLLAVRFAPNWLTFQRGAAAARAQAVSPAERAVLERTFTTNYYVARGHFVTEQARDLGTEIGDANHKIVRWRLLMPALGHVLGLPSWLLLGLAQAGCLGLVVALVAIGLRPTPSDRSWWEAACLGLVAGASAPFFTSMGWLGYYDAWLALALLAVAFAGPRRLVLLACVLAPWIDERFVIGLPLALCVRRLAHSGEPTPRLAWLKEQALGPLLLVAAYTLLRLKLGGSGGSQTIGQYLDQFVFAEKIPFAQRLFGAWKGLGPGWLLVLAAVLGAWRWSGAARRGEAGLLAAGVVLTALVGLFTALDLSRSMVLLVPVVPLGWRIAARTAWWRRFYVAPVLALAAYLTPASNVIGNVVLPVDGLMSYCAPLAAAHYNAAVILAEIPDRQAEALAHYTTAVQVKPDYAEAHNNLGNLLVNRLDRRDEAIAHYAEALRLKPDYADAHNNLANQLAALPGRLDEAIAHYREALRIKPDFASAHNNLAVQLGARPEGRAEALAHYLEALRLQPEFAAAHYNVAVLLGTLPGREEEALAHYAEALRVKPDHAEAHNNLAAMLARLPGRHLEALAHYAAALRVKPDYAEAHNNLAILLATLPERRHEALVHYEAALRVRADFGAAHYNLAALLGMLPGRQVDALAHFAAAVRLLPGNSTVHLNFARQLEAVAERKVEAASHYDEALRLDPSLSVAREALARLRK
ncbi:MAG: hypothetical protein RL077_3411 [Verrucomicrobiota bacterium]